MQVEATGRLNQDGKLRVGGLIRGLEDFDLTARVEEAPVFETGNYRFLAEGDLAARPAPDGDTLRPRLSGTLRVLEGLITQDLAKPPPTRQPPYTPWLIDLTVKAPGNFRLNQPAMTVDLGEGEMRVTFRWPYWNLAGEIDVQGGRYRIFNRTLRITSGTVRFEDTGKGPDPYFDIQAETEVTGPDDKVVPVTLHVTGYPARKELEVALSSSGNAAYTEAELIELMSLGQLTSREFGTFGQADPTTQALSSELVGQVERQLVSQLPWADRIQLEGQLNDPASLRFSVRPIVQPQWSVGYSQGLSATDDREVSLRYRLSDLLFLNAQVEHRQHQSGEPVPIDAYSLDLRFRVEY